jgi:hypothetical protein
VKQLAVDIGRVDVLGSLAEDVLDDTSRPTAPGVTLIRILYRETAGGVSYIMATNLAPRGLAHLRPPPA